MSLILIFLITLILIFLWCDTRKPDNFPPGPKWLPIVGCIPLIKQVRNIYKFYHLVWQHFSLHYGPITGFRIGRDKLIIISGKDAIKEFYSCEEFNGRPIGFFFRVRSFNKRLGVVFTDGKKWEIQKKFSLKAIKQLCSGRNGMICHVEKETAAMIQYFQAKTKNNDPIDMANAFDIPVLNVMWALLAGYRFDEEDERLKMLMQMIHESFRVIDMSGGVLNQFPFLRYIFPEQSGYSKLVRTLKPLWKFLLETIQEIRENMVSPPNDVPKCLIEAFLYEIELNIHDKESTFNEEQLLSLCLDFFQAGSETTSNTLGFGIMYMLHNPDVMKRLRAELTSIVGESRLPSYADRPNLPFTEAVVCEIQRFSSVAPVAIAHRATEDVKLSSYYIRKDTIAMVSLYSLNMDVSYWGDPNVFRPDRFLNENGQLLQHEAFIPFGLGKRRCMGENIARTSLFLFFSAFIHCFDIEIPANQKLPDLAGIDGITLSPKPYKVLLKSK